MSAVIIALDVQSLSLAQNFQDALCVDVGVKSMGERDR